MDELTSAFLLPAARKRTSGVWVSQLFSELILGQLMPDVLGYLCLILAYRIDIVTTAPELPITIFELQLSKLFVTPFLDHRTPLPK
jgi:hypothetical protein